MLADGPKGVPGEGDTFEGLRRLDGVEGFAQAEPSPAIAQCLNGGSGLAEREFGAPLLRSPPGGNPGGTKSGWKDSAHPERRSGADSGFGAWATAHQFPPEAAPAAG
jgi:hypothetical protein